MCSIAEYFYSLFVLWFALQACQNKAQFVKNTHIRYIYKLILYIIYNIYNWFSSTNGSRESMRPLWFFHLYILSSATTALSTLCQGRLYPPFICVYVYIFFFYLSTCALTRKHIAHFFILDPCWQVSNKHLMIIWSIASRQPCISSVHSPTSILRWAGRSRLGPWWWL